jgi:hypothetical protein
MSVTVVFALLLHSLWAGAAAVVGPKRLLRQGEFVSGPKAKNGEQPSSSLEGSFDAFLPWVGTEQRRATARTAASGTHQQRKLIHNGVPTGGNKYPFLVSTWGGTSLDVRRNFESMNASPSIIHLHGFPFVEPDSLGGEHDFDNPKSLSRSDAVERRVCDDSILRAKYVSRGDCFGPYSATILLAFTNYFSFFGSARFVSEGSDRRL